ncbi:hypothetical protein ARMSODRAFT_768733 [Armillaria solidipes]|uniref:Uncharacterized protein n=1 Tax=Armillaria solidipes TaxID=1076256 RepID=A0A2H3B1Q3_9AGAR|nr:hypothetical protein ARMSODRAFT_768733 [Armillaria solidipes]
MTFTVSLTCTTITSVHQFLIFTFKAPAVHLTLPHFDIVVLYRSNGHGSQLVESPLMGSTRPFRQLLHRYEDFNHQYFSRRTGYSSPNFGPSSSCASSLCLLCLFVHVLFLFPYEPS